jgi:hypothetical protein
MLGRIATLVGYSKAPRATFVMRHPVKGTRALVAAKGIKGLVTTRAGAALSAMALLPVGIWAARGLARRH